MQARLVILFFSVVFSIAFKSLQSRPLHPFALVARGDDYVQDDEKDDPEGKRKMKKQKGKKQSKQPKQSGDGSLPPAPLHGDPSEGASSGFPIPASTGNVLFKEVQHVYAGKPFDGGFKTYGRGVTCSPNREGDDVDAVFLVEDGGTLQNAIIGPDQQEGVHCTGRCTIKNVWWTHVCEDALTLKGATGDATVIGGGARGAIDKVIQHDGHGKVSINGFIVQDFGKLYRSCGDCADNSAGPRHVTIANVKAYNGKALAGVNYKGNDTATFLEGNCATNVDDICEDYTGALKTTGADANCIYTKIPPC